VSTHVDENVVRKCAIEVLRLIDHYGGDISQLKEGLVAPARKLVDRPDLLNLGVHREGNHVGFSLYLYYDPGLAIIMSHLPKGSTIPVHDHGGWEAFTPYRGTVRHTLYARVDDDTVPGHARLDVLEERVLNPGDIALLVPPADIHGWSALKDDTYTIAFLGAEFNQTRRYYQPDQESYLIRNQKSWRTGR
jgi:predicted metal-dependent enzyme (double-stranded beta helix superfamily)